MGSEAIGNMCRSIAAWAKEVGKAKLDVGADDIQPIIDSVQASPSLSKNINGKQIALIAAAS